MAPPRTKAKTFKADLEAAEQVGANLNQTQRRRAVRAIADFQLDADLRASIPFERQIALYQGMKLSLEGKKSRVTKHLFAGWIQQLTTSTKLCRKFWVVPRTRVDELVRGGKMPADADMPRSKLVLPPGFSLEACAVVDQMVDRSLLGLGVYELEFELKSTQFMTDTDGESDHQSAGPSSSGGRPGPVVVPESSPVVEPMSPEPPSKRQKVPKTLSLLDEMDVEEDRASASNSLA